MDRLHEKNEVAPNIYEKIKPIPTRYAATIFKSRLEARWAVFFDGMGIKWRYEYEGYNVNGKYYLPDFYLPEVKGEHYEPVGVFCEVKPLVDAADERIFELAKLTGRKTVLLVGEPSENFESIPGLWGYEAARAGECWDNGHDFAICNKTGDIGIIFEGQHRWPRINGLGDKSHTVSGYDCSFEEQFEFNRAASARLAKRWTFTW